MFKNKYLVSVSIISLMLSSLHLYAMEDEKEYIYKAKATSTAKKFIRGKVFEEEGCVFGALNTLYFEQRIDRDAFFQKLSGVVKGSDKESTKIKGILIEMLCNTLKKLPNNKEEDTFSQLKNIQEFASKLSPHRNDKGWTKQNEKPINGAVRNPQVIDEFITYLSEQEETYFLPHKKKSSGEKDFIDLICQLYKLKLRVFIPDEKNNQLALGHTFSYDKKKPKRYAFFDKEKMFLYPACSSKDEGMLQNFENKRFAMSVNRKDMTQKPPIQDDPVTSEEESPKNQSGKGMESKRSLPSLPSRRIKDLSIPAEKGQNVSEQKNNKPLDRKQSALGHIQNSPIPLQIQIMQDSTRVTNKSGITLKKTDYVQSIKNVEQGIQVITNNNAEANYQLESDRFDVVAGQMISVPYDITVEAGGIISLGLLNTAGGGWYGDELILRTGPHQQGTYTRKVPANETETSLVFRNYHLESDGGPGQTTFILHDFNFKIDEERPTG